MFSHCIRVICVTAVLLSCRGHLPPWNVAMLKPAYQINTACGGIASRATDGDEGLHYNQSLTCSQTEALQTTWWMVDLQGLYLIEQIHIYNRGDCCSEWLDNVFTIDTFTTDPRRSARFPHERGKLCFAKFGRGLNPGLFVANCSAPMLGRFVRIMKYNNAPLVLCEVKVWTSKILQRYASYVARVDYILQPQAPSGRLFTNSRIRCAARCTEMRDLMGCSGFNWFPLTRLCQIMTTSDPSGLMYTEIRDPEGVGKNEMEISSKVEKCS